MCACIITDANNNEEFKIWKEADEKIIPRITWWQFQRAIAKVRWWKFIDELCPEPYTDPLIERQELHFLDIRDPDEIDKMLKFIEENVEDLKEAFALFDKKGVGEISTSKLIKVLRALGENPTEETLDDMINECDTDGDGSIDFIEFVHMAYKISRDADEIMKEAFSIFDDDGSGSITHEEFRRVVLEEGGGNLREEDVEMIINEVDKDGDGEINMDEFVKMLVGN